jgi:hypothetical protein
MAAETCPECGRELSSAGSCSYCDDSLLPLIAPAPEPEPTAVVVPAVAQTTVLSIPESIAPISAPYSQATTPAPPIAPQPPAAAASAALEPASVRPAAPMPVTGLASFAPPAAYARPAATASRSDSYSAADLTAWAYRAQAMLTPTAWICGLILIAIVVYLNIKMTPPQALPSGIATMASALGPQPNVNPTPGSSLNSDASQYLQFLQKIDLQRVGLISGFEQALATAANQSTGAPQTAQNSFSQSAQQLMADYLFQKAPTDCSDVSDNYFRLIQDQTQMIDKAGGSLATGDVRGAMGIRDAAAAQIATDAQNADSSLSQLCAVQHIDKPFTIVGDPANTTPDNAPAPQTQPSAQPPNQPLTEPPPTQPIPATAPTEPAQPAPDPSQTNSGPAPVSG